MTAALFDEFKRAVIKDDRDLIDELLNQDHLLLDYILKTNPASEVRVILPFIKGEVTDLNTRELIKDCVKIGGLDLSYEDLHILLGGDAADLVKTNDEVRFNTNSTKSMWY